MERRRVHLKSSKSRRHCRYARSDYLDAGMAYIHRSRMYALAKCYAQAAKDAEAAVKYFQSCTRALTMPGQCDPDALSMTHIYHPGTTSPFRRARIEPLAWAWCVLTAKKQWCSHRSFSLPALPPGSRAARRSPPKIVTRFATGVLPPLATCALWIWTRGTRLMQRGWLTPPAS